MRTPARAAMVIAVLTAVAVPATAQAATKTTSAGPPLAAPPPGVPEYSDAPQFFPRTTSVHVGDTVRWKFAGFHSVYFPKKAGRLVPLFAADAARKYDEKDPAGSPFHFNGRPHMIANPPAVFPVGGKAYDGRRAVGSGLPEGRTFSYRLKFTKAGSFTYFCTIHPRMKGTVKVRPRRARITSAAVEKRASDRQLSAAITRLKRDDRRAAQPGDVVEAGRDTTGTSLLAFYPTKKAVAVGGALEFRMATVTNEVHTVTFGSPAVLAKGGYVEGLAQQLFAPLPGTGQNGPPVLGLPGAIFHPSDPGPLAFDGSQHGGFATSGVMGDGPPLPTRVRFSFPKAGTYDYLCLIHPEMKGQIEVK